MPPHDSQLDALSSVPVGAGMAELALKRKRLQLQAEAARLAAEAAEMDEEIARAEAAAKRSAAAPATAKQVPIAAAVVAKAISAVPAIPGSPPIVAAKLPAQAPVAQAPPAAAKVSTAPPVPQKKESPGKQPPAKSANKAPEEEKEAAPAQPPRWSRLIGAVPSWAVSMIVHMILILALALFTLPPVLKEQFRVLEGSVASPIEELIEEAETQIEFEAPVTNSFASIIAPSEMGMASLGESAVVSTNLTSMSESDLNLDSTVGELGQLFGSEGKGMASVGTGDGGAEFFGVKASGRRFVFIVDSSKSMNSGKFEDACEELFYAVQRLKTDQFFYVIFFDHDAARMTFAPNKEPEESFAPATVANIKKLQDWMKTVELELATNPYEAVVFARKLVPDAIYILTDGQFTDKGKTEKFLKDNNLFEDPSLGTSVKAVIHTVGFYDANGEETLKRIATLHKGTYRFVPRPKKK